MDPNTTLSEIVSALAGFERELAEEQAEDLLAWLGNGGFAPETQQAPDNVTLDVLHEDSAVLQLVERGCLRVRIF